MAVPTILKMAITAINLSNSLYNKAHGHKAETCVLKQDALPSHEQYKSNIGGANIYAPFKSEWDRKTAQWAKM